MDIEKKQKIAEYNRNYYQKNKERLKQRSLERYRENNDHYKEQQKQYYYKKSEGVKRRKVHKQMKQRMDSILRIKIGDMVFVLDESELE